MRKSCVLPRETFFFAFGLPTLRREGMKGKESAEGVVVIGNEPEVLKKRPLNRATGVTHRDEGLNLS